MMWLGLAAAAAAAPPGGGSAVAADDRPRRISQAVEFAAATADSRPAVVHVEACGSH